MTLTTIFKQMYYLIKCNEIWEIHLFIHPLNVMDNCDAIFSIKCYDNVFTKLLAAAARENLLTTSVWNQLGVIRHRRNKLH